jgi:hypothetical protein
MRQPNVGIDLTNNLKSFVIPVGLVTGGGGVASISGANIQGMVVGDTAFISGYLAFTTDGVANSDRYIYVDVSAIRRINFSVTTDANGSAVYLGAGVGNDIGGAVFSNSGFKRILVYFESAFGASTVIAPRFSAGFKIA